MSTGPESFDPSQFFQYLSAFPSVGSGGLRRALQKSIEKTIKEAGFFELLKEHFYAIHPSKRLKVLQESLLVKHGVTPLSAHGIILNELIKRTRALAKRFPGRLPRLAAQPGLPSTLQLTLPPPKIPSPEAATRALGSQAMMGITGLLGSAIGGAIGGGPGAAIGGLMAAMAGADMDIPGAEVPKPPAGATTWQKFKWAMHPRNIFASQLRTLRLLGVGLAAGLPALVTSKIMEEAARRQQQVSTLEGGGGAAVRSDNALSSLIQRITSQARVHPGNRW